MKEIKVLLEALKDPNEDVRADATQALWQIWFGQKGVAGLQTLQRAQVLLESGEATQAEGVLSELIEKLPDFAEAWNRRAVLYFVQQQYRKAIADCQKTIELNPIHFGALHGLGLSYAALGEYQDAIGAFRQALKVQPYAIENQRLILECTAKLS
ncbi:MAG: tetratricopeptide repeat protein [Plectolyngbya sp. WJT66-NPBG17]|jgi:tetratricopeptide (TPR) repeat protein|nr:tetratricopeptide repeat protein [Plectolyngbya sp. WJT66-NPBG17]MBW4527807.1 tetratricopeptide repeat protein [Phormidium tanganyikae FI6-MK23]